jgi:hypothetical protein
LLDAAAAAPALARWIDPDAPAFVRPSDMTRAIRGFCKQTDQPEGREIVWRSFPPKTFLPAPRANWDAVYGGFSHHCRNSAH